MCRQKLGGLLWKRAATEGRWDLVTEEKEPGAKRQRSNCKGPEARNSSVCLRTGKEASAAAVQDCGDNSGR